MFILNNNTQNNSMKIKCKVSFKKGLKFKFEANGIIKIYIFKFICVKKLNIGKYIIPKTEKIKEENDKFLHKVILNKDGISTIKDIIKTIKIEKFDGSFFFNLDEPIINSYINSIINTIIPIILKISNANYKNIKYCSGISEEILDVKIKCIISIPIVKNISSILKLLFLFMKGGRKNGRKTSNRISNDYINDIN